MLCSTHLSNTRAQSPRNRRSGLAALICLALALAGPGSAHAEKPAPAAIDIPLGPFSVDVDNPENSIPTAEMAAKYPLEMGYLMMALAEHADAATARGDHAKAAHFYMALAKGVPERATGFRKACESWVAAKDWDQAAEWCGAALGHEGIKVADQMQYVHVMIERKGPLEGKALADVNAVLQNMEEVSAKTEHSQKQLVSLRCRLAVNQEDVPGLEKCVHAMLSWPRKDSQRFLFGTMLATKQQDWAKAEKLLDEGEQAGVTPALVKSAREQIAARKQLSTSQARNRFMSTWLPVLGVAIGLGMLMVVVFRRRAKPGLA